MVANRHIIASLILVAALAPSLARAEPAPQPSDSDRATARALFEESLELMRADDYERACDKLEASSELVAGAGILFNLAECYAHIGKRQRARVLYLDVAAKMGEAGDEQRQQVALERAAALAPSEPSEPQPPAAKTVAVAATPARKPRPTPNLATELPPELRPENPEDVRYRQQAVGWGLIIGGGLATAVGFGVFAAGTSALGEAEQRCGIGVCSDQDAAAMDDGVAQQRAGLPIAIAGSTSLVAGLITLALANSASTEPNATRPAVQVAAGPQGGRVGVRFAW